MQVYTCTVQNNPLHAQTFRFEALYVCKITQAVTEYPCKQRNESHTAHIALSQLDCAMELEGEAAPSVRSRVSHGRIEFPRDFRAIVFGLQ